MSVLTRSDNPASWVEAAATVSKVDNLAFDFFTVTFPQALSSPSTFYVLGSRLHERSTDLIRGGTLNSNELEKEESKQGVVLQELRRDLSRSAVYPPDFTGYGYLPSPKLGASLVWSSDGRSLTDGLKPDTAALAWREALANEVAIRVSDDLCERTERFAADNALHRQIDGIIPAVTNLTA